MRWITFDCFGTLVDWHSGFASILTSIVGDRAPQVLERYHRYERLLERETPHMLYKDVLAESLSRAAAEVGVPLTDRQARHLPERWATLPVFDDVEPMLEDLRATGCRLAVLTNCDDDLFEHTQQSFRFPFDLVVTAERVRDYKPSPAHFRYFSRCSGVRKDDWIHVACSWYHDIAPARELGINRIWLDRDDTGEDSTTASAHIRSASQICEAVARIGATFERTFGDED
jgi:2-haloacid dehalogenase